MSFKKASDVAERNRSQLRKKEINKLRSDIVSLFRVTDEEISTLFNSKSNTESAKLMNKSILYYVDGIPYMLDEGGRNKLIPTLQFMWKFPSSLRTFLIHSQVSKFVLNGADLMLPGVAVIDNLVGVEEGEVCAVRVLGNPLPFAVGRSLCSWDGILTNNRRGRALQTVLCFNDLLSGIGMGFTSHGPNSGFLCNAPFIYHLDGWEEDQEGELVIEDCDSDDLDNAEDQQSQTENSIEASDTNVFSSSLSMPSISQSSIEVLEEIAITTSRRAEPTSAQRQMMDLRLKNALILLLKHVVKDKALPTLVNVLWPTLLRIGKFLYATSNPGLITSEEVAVRADNPSEESVDHVAEEVGAQVLDAKRSHHRSASAFLQWAQREGILTLIENDASDALSIASVNRTHPLFRAIRLANPDALKAFLEAEAPVQEDTKGTNSKLEIIITETFKLPKNMRDVMKDVAASSKSSLEEYVTLTQLKTFLTNHFKEKQSELTSDRAYVVLATDDPLWNLGQAALKKSASANADAPSAKRASEQPMANTKEDAPDEMPVLPCYDDQSDEEDWTDAQKEPDAQSGGCVVAGVWMPSAGLSFKSTTEGAKKKQEFTISPATSISAWRSPSMAKVVSLPSKATAAKKAGEAKARDGLTAVNNSVSELPAAKKEKHPSADIKPTEIAEPLTIRKDVLMKYVSSKLTRCYSIQQYPGAVPIFAVGSAPTVEIVVELVRARKYMTRVRGLETFGVDLTELARNLQKKLASAASVGPSTENPQKKDVFVQGNMAHQIQEFLCNDCGFKRSMVVTTLKKGVK